MAHERLVASRYEQLRAYMAAANAAAPTDFYQLPAGGALHVSAIRRAGARRGDSPRRVAPGGRARNPPADKQAPPRRAPAATAKIP